jgi:phage tail-like protein
VVSQAREDPFAAFNFVVQLVDDDGENRIVAGFSECSGLESTLEVEEYQEGGVNNRVYKFPSTFSFTNITLKHGVTTNESLRQWHNELLQGNVKRRNGLVILLNESREAVLAWKFERGLPVKYTAPDFNAAQNEVAVETLEIAHERLEPFDVERI